MALSDRIRPNCEAAPWVIAEVRELESKLAKAREALELYADPFKNKEKIENETSIPDFYNDTDFGMFAREALKEME